MLVIETRELRPHARTYTAAYDAACTSNVLGTVSVKLQSMQGIQPTSTEKNGRHCYGTERYDYFNLNIDSVITSAAINRLVVIK
jgi:hypothetical protein